MTKPSFPVIKKLKNTNAKSETAWRFLFLMLKLRKEIKELRKNKQFKILGMGVSFVLN